jgi:hypothetical protein
LNRKILAFTVAIGIIAIGWSGILYFTLPLREEVKKEIWLPHQYHIANINDGYAAISEYRTNAVEISFEKMQELYEDKFSNENFEIIVQQNGTINYVWDFQGITFIAKQHNNLWYPGHDGIITDVSSNGQITILYQARIEGSIVMVLILVLGIIIGVVIWPK